LPTHEAARFHPSLATTAFTTQGDPHVSNGNVSSADPTRAPRLPGEDLIAIEAPRRLRIDELLRELGATTGIRSSGSRHRSGSRSR
jgi:hypothetical protein